jgi:hypothetical protein
LTLRVSIPQGYGNAAPGAGCSCVILMRGNWDDSLPFHRIVLTANEFDQ